MNRTVLLLTVLVTGLAACQPQAPERTAAGAKPPSDALLPILPPTLDELAPAAREQIERAAAAPAQLQDSGAGEAELGQAFGELGTVYHAYGLHDSAENPYLNARRLRPADPRWPYYLGHVYRQRGDVEAAVANFERALALEPDDVASAHPRGDVPSRVWLARMLIERGEYAAAEPHLIHALELDPDCASALLFLGHIAAGRKQPAAAIRRYRAVLELQPEATRVHYPLAQAYRALGDVERARAHLELRGDRQVGLVDPLLSALAALGRSSRGLEQEGVELFHQRRFVEAVKLLREAVAADPDNLSARLNLGTALGAAGDAAGAAAALEEVVRRQPGNAKAHYNLGSLADQRGAAGEAVAYFQAAIAANPRYRNAYWSLANLLARSGRCAEALEPYARTVELDPSLVDVRLARARCLEQLGRYAAARESLAAARAAHPEDPRIAGALARLPSPGE